MEKLSTARLEEAEERAEDYMQVLANNPAYSEWDADETLDEALFMLAQFKKQRQEVIKWLEEVTARINAVQDILER